jgi:hypothetical protein
MFPPPDDRLAWLLGTGMPTGTGVLLPIAAASVEESGAALLALEIGLAKEPAGRMVERDDCTTVTPSAKALCHRIKCVIAQYFRRRGGRVRVYEFFSP